MVDGGWNLPSVVMADPGVVGRIRSIVLPTTPLSDSLVWSHSSDGKLTSKQAFDFLRLVDVVIPWAVMISKIHPSFLLFYFMAHYAWKNAHG